MAAVSGVRCAQGIARPFCPLRSTLTPDTAAKALASRFNRAPTCRCAMLVCGEADKTEWKNFATAKPPYSPAAERAPVNAGSFEFPTFNFMVLA